MPLHELTCTLRPILYAKTPKQQFEITSIYMKQILAPYRYSGIAELTKEHNVHYHCVVDITDLAEKDKLLNRFRQFNKFLGRKTLEMVRYEESYMSYMIKDYQITSKIIGDPILKDDYNIIDKLALACARLPYPDLINNRTMEWMIRNDSLSID